MTNHTLALIQARMSSSRFPGKVLEPVQGLPLVVYMARRAARAERLDGVVVVTSTDSSDDPLERVLDAAAIPVFRGDLNDVLKRYADAAAAHGATEIVRLTGDCPLIDPVVIDAVIDARRAVGADYSSNVDPPSFPDGLDVECFTCDALVRAHALATRTSEREHVTVWMRSEAAGLRRVNYRAIADFSAVRLTVDYPDDLSLVRRLLDRLPTSGGFDFFDLIRELSTAAALQKLNPHERNEGLAKSLAEEASRIA